MLRSVPRRRDRLLLAGALAAGVAGTALAYRAGMPTGILGRRGELVLDVALWWVVFAGGVACVLRAPRRAAVGLVLLFAVAMRLAALAPVASTSDDLYRYSWDGRVQAAGIDPYRYPPNAPELEFLREEWLWPDIQECDEKLSRGPGCTRINRPGARTIYPPATQVWFRVLYETVPQSARDVGYQVAGGVVDLALVGLLLGLLRRWGRDPRWVVIYAWAPVAVLEAVTNAHVDGLAALVAVAAVAAARSRPLVASALLAVGTLVKLYPALFLPLAVRRRPLLASLVFLAVVALGYLRHVLDVGIDVLGYLPGYIQEEGYDEGGRYLLLSPLGLSGTVATVAALAVLGGVVLLVLSRFRDAEALAHPERDALLLFAALLLLATPVQPWYALTLAALAVLVGQLRWLAIAAAGYPPFFAVILDGPDEEWGRASYGAALLVLLAAALRDRRRARSPVEAPIS
jgi:hypothetical protein